MKRGAGSSSVAPDGLHRNLIGGEWVGGGDAIDNINPSDTTDNIGSYAQASAAEVDTAISAAATAYRSWSARTAQERADVLDAAGTELLARQEELGTLLAREEGKPLGEAIGEAARTGRTFKYYAGEAIRLGGETLARMRPGIQVGADRVPIGPVGLITPWNFPLAIPGWKIAPALAYGCTVVFKPANLVPGSAHALAEILWRAGLDGGEFNLVMGRGSEVGDRIANASALAGVSFTGSTGTGARVGQACMQRGARVQLEMGGKNPIIVLDDADIEQAVKAATIGAFFQTGQRCTASSRIIVTDAIHDRFVDAMVAHLGTLRVDHALSHDTHIGPAVDQGQYEQDVEYIRIGREEGAEIAFGGGVLERETPGYFVSPTLFTGTRNDMRINREEMFGPIAGVIRANDYEEALAIANDTQYGLAASLCTRNASYMEDFRRRAEAGLVMFNLPTAGLDYHAPFGGTKASSYGTREQGTYAREFYTTVKTWYASTD